MILRNFQNILSNGSQRKTTKNLNDPELKDIEIIGHAEDSHEAVEVVERLKPNVVILDIRMPISITQQIRD